MQNSKSFFNFIHFLRGIAVLLVLWAHLGSWWLGTNGVNSILQYGWSFFVVKPLQLYQDGGHLGVLIFFLISGFIITYVADNETPLEFIVKRAFRIVPTLLIALIIMRLATLISQAYGLSFPLGMASNETIDYILTFLLLNRPLGSPDVLSATWSLFVEVVFYALTFLLMEKSKREPIISTVYMLFILLLFVLASSLNPVLKRTADLTIYIFYILIGRVIYYGMQEKIRKPYAIILGMTSLLSFIFLYDYLLPNRMFTSGIMLIYSDLLAIFLFFASMFLVKSRVKGFSFFADISYAVYLIHIPMGSLVLNMLFSVGIPFEINIIVAVSIVTGLSWMINKLIEVPAQNIARKLILNNVNRNNLNI